MRKSVVALFSAVALVVVMLAVPAKSQQDKSQKPSPPAHAECKFADGGTITIDYSSPRLRGRKVIGEQNPYGKPWRAGANEATTFVLSKSVHIGSANGGVDVPAGNYTLFAIPNKDTHWVLIISKKTGEWGIPYPGEQFELGRAEMTEDVIPSMENFTISLTPSGNDAFDLHLAWDTVDAHVKVAEKK